MILAEAVSIDGGALLVIIVVLLVMVAAWCAAVVAGCVWARRAGRGSRAALAAWAVAAVVESLSLIAGFAFLMVGPVAALGVQGVFYFWGRADAARGA